MFSVPEQNWQKDGKWLEKDWSLADSNFNVWCEIKLKRYESILFRGVNFRIKWRDFFTIIWRTQLDAIPIIV